jgi:uncharacterized protein YjbI with pentapeptide repeats
VSEGAKLNFLRGVTLSDDLFAQVIKAAPHDDRGRAILHAADFEGTVFPEKASFQNLRFTGNTEFHFSTFKGSPNFYGSVFGGGDTLFLTTTSFIVDFDHGVSFRQAEFESHLDFSATVNGPCSFNFAEFHAGANFHGATFKEAPYFYEAKFEDHVRESESKPSIGYFFDAATFENGVSFRGSTFGAPADFEGATIKGWADFSFVTFEQGVSFNYARLPHDIEHLDFVIDGGELKLSHISFSRFMHIEARAEKVDCYATRFAGGGHLGVAATEISLEQAEFPAPFVVAPSDRAQDMEIPPHITSLKGANVAGLILTNVDLSRCRFAGAYNLDCLKIEGLDGLSQDRGFFTGRAMIAEEKEWRRRHALWASTSTSAEAMRSTYHDDTPSPEIIASIYRGLRKGREDNKDEPGAADFYYGEMEMRRKSKSSPLAEHVILWWYWALSGYGLRASRALITLLGILAVFSTLFHLYGFQYPNDPFTQSQIQVSRASSRVTAHWPPTFAELRNAALSTEAWTYSIGTATTIFNSPDALLTRAGRRLRLLLRIIGPILLGLAILAIRGRVKR